MIQNIMRDVEFQKSLSEPATAADALEGVLSVEDGRIVSGGSMPVIGCLAIGALLGELLNLEDKFERFSEWLKVKSGNAGEMTFVDGFVTALLTVCIGA